MVMESTMPMLGQVLQLLSAQQAEQAFPATHPLLEPPLRSLSVTAGLLPSPKPSPAPRPHPTKGPLCLATEGAI